MGIFNEDELEAAAAGPGPEDTAPPQDQGQDQPPADNGQPRDEAGRFAPKQPAEGDQGDRNPSERTVEHGALHSERERRKTAEADLKKAQEFISKIAEMRSKVGQPQQPQADVPPPVGYQQPGQGGEETVDQLRARLARLEQAENQRTTAMEHSRLDDAEQRQLAQALVSSEQEFAARTPDYQAATEHLATARAQELALYGMDPVSIRQALAEEALEITRTAISLGRQPAELAYEIARHRGYQPKAVVTTPPANGGGQQQNGQSAADMVAAIKRAQDSSKSLGVGGSSGGVGEINVQALANMSEDEFERLYNTPEGKRLIDSMG